MNKLDLIINNIAKDNKITAVKMLGLFYTTFDKLTVYHEIGFSRPDFTYNDVKFFILKKHYLIVYKIVKNEITF